MYLIFIALVGIMMKMPCPSARSPYGGGGCGCSCYPFPHLGLIVKVHFLFTDGAHTMVNAVVFLFHFDSCHFFLLMTKSYCLSGINISELLPSPNPIIYI